MAERKYRILETSDEEFTLKPVTFGLYENVKRAQLSCSAFEKESKDAIKKEFNIDENEKIEAIGMRELYKTYVKELFFDVPAFEVDDVRIDEVNKAIRDFFSRAAGQ